MLELLLLAGVAGTIWFLRYRQTRTIIPAGAGGTNKAYIGRLLLLVLFGGFIYALIFTNLPIMVSAWNPSATPIGTALQPITGEWTNLVIWVALVLVGLKALQILRPKKARTVVGQPVSIGDQIFMIGGLAITAALVGVVGLVILAIGDAATGGGVGRMGDRFILAPTGVIDLNPPSTVACGQLEERFGRNGSDGRLGYNYVIAVICPGDGQQYVKVVQTGHTDLDIGFHQSELNQHGIALSSRSPDDFFSIRNAGTTSYFVTVNPAPFRDLGVDHLKVRVRTTP